MGETPAWKGKQVRQLRRERYHDEPLGDEAVRFATWFAKSKFQLMESFLGELDRRPAERDRAALRERFLHACKHGQQVLIVQGVVTALLAFGVVVTASSAALDRLQTINDNLLPGLFHLPLGELRTLLVSIQAIAGSATLILILARFAVARYLALVEVSATYLGMQIASARYA
jgi:hypothetical protein